MSKHPHQMLADHGEQLRAGLADAYAAAIRELEINQPISAVCMFFTGGSLETMALGVCTTSCRTSLAALEDEHFPLTVWNPVEWDDEAAYPELDGPVLELAGQLEEGFDDALDAMLASGSEDEEKFAELFDPLSRFIAGIAEELDTRDFGAPRSADFVTYAYPLDGMDPDMIAQYASPEARALLFEQGLLSEATSWK